MDDREAPDPLKDLGARIDKAYDAQQTGSRSGRSSAGSNSAMGVGLRIGVELVVAVVVGVGAGYLLDRWLGTRPWGMLGCFFTGVAAGMVNVYRTITGIGMAAGYGNTGYGNTGPRVVRVSDDDDED